MRARYPDRDGVVDRAGVDIFYEVYENPGPTLLLVAAAPITHTRSWKGLIPYLSRHFRVVVLDGRGNGRSGRPTSPEAHNRAANVGDMVAVLDATETDQAVLVAHCHANWWALEFISDHPRRANGLIAIEPGLPHVGKPQPHWVETAPNWDRVLDNPVGWNLFNRNVIVTQHQSWIEFFFTQQLVESHSTKQFEDMVAWALESTGEVLAASEEGIEIDLPERDEFREVCRNLAVPVLVIHGELDVCQSVSKGVELAELTDGELLVIEGGGHLPQGKDPVRVNLAIRDFVERTKRAA